MPRDEYESKRKELERFITAQRIPALFEADGVATLYRYEGVIANSVPRGDDVYLTAANILNGLE